MEPLHGHITESSIPWKFYEVSQLSILNGTQCLNRVYMKCILDPIDFLWQFKESTFTQTFDGI